MANAGRIASWGIKATVLALALLAGGCGAANDAQADAAASPNVMQSAAPAGAIPVERSYLVCSQSCPDPTPRQVCKDNCARRFNRCKFSEDTCETHYLQCVGLCEVNYPLAAPDGGRKKP